MNDDLGEYIRERFRELQSSFDLLAQRVEDKTGDHAVRIAKLELRVDQTNKTLQQAIEGRRWHISTWISASASLIALASALLAVIIH